MRETQTKGGRGMDGTANGRIAFLDLLKAVCLLGVILGHLCTWQIAEVSPGSAAWDVSNAYNAACRVCVPVFLMVSGYLALGQDHAARAKPRQAVRAAGRFALTYLVWAAVYALPNWRGIAAAPATLPAVLAKGEFHLWYLLMLAGLYLLLPLLYRVTRAPADRRYALAVAAAVTLLPTLALLPGFAWLDTLRAKCYLDAGYLLYFLLGYALRCAPPGPAVRRALYAAGAAATVWNAAATRVLSQQAGTFADPWLDQRSATVALGAAALFVLAQRHGGRLPAPAARLAGALARRGLGVYAVHVVFLLLLRKFGISVYALPPAVGLPLLAVGILAASWLVAAAAHHIPGIRKFV